MIAAARLDRSTARRAGRSGEGATGGAHLERRVRPRLLRGHHRRAAREGAVRRGGVAGGVYEWLTEAMQCFERAEAIRPAGNDDAMLRWNACVRLLKEHPNLRPTLDDRREPQFLE